MMYKYKAIKDGKLVVDKIDADSPEGVIRFLKSNNYFPVPVWRADISSFPLTNFLNQLSFNDIADFTRQLSIMLEAGLTLIDALEILKAQTTKASVINLLQSIDKEIKSGKNFSTALSQFPQYFSSLYIALVKSGEATGKLSEILLKLSDNLEKEKKFRGKLRAALIYPVFIIFGMIVVGFIMMTFVVPKLLELYKDFGAQLPLSTQILLFVSGFFTRFWPLIILASVGIIMFVSRYLKTAKGKFQLDSVLLRLPVIGNVIKMATLVDSTRTLSILTSSGVSLLETLSIVIETSSNIVYKNAFFDIKKQVEKGTSLGQAMKQASIFPPILVQMTLIGEQTGHLDDTLIRVSRYFESDSELAIKAMTTLIEPTILVVLGVGVGFLVFAIITPIYTLTTSLK